MSVSIVDVAKAAGVSHSTVSRVLNNRPGVSPASAERVLSAIRDTGYAHRDRRPGRKPREHRAVGTTTIGLVMVGVEVDFARSPVAATVFHTVEAELTERGYALVVCRVDESKHLPQLIERSQTDGLLLYGTVPPPSIARILRTRPSVWLLSERAGAGYWGDRVGPDNQAIGVAAAEYLIELGHRRVGMVRLEGQHLGFDLRARSFREVCEHAGVEVVEYACDAEGGDRIAEAVCSEAHRPLGLFIPRDRLTAQVLSGVARRNPALARTIDVMSCDNDPVLDALQRRPATIDIRPREIGRRAVQQLLARIERPDAGTRSLLTVEPRLVPAGPPVSNP
ncbi:MAG: LacI family DNA-binding transcriptional regulator [Planctomycetota bacterium]